MNIWDALFTTHPAEPPQFGFTWYASTFTLLFLTIYLAYRYRDNKVCQRFFQIIQAIQLISLYSWYWIISSRCQKACLFIIADQPCLQFSCFQVFQKPNSILLCLEPSGRLQPLFIQSQTLTLSHTSLFCPLFSDIQPFLEIP